MSEEAEQELSVTLPISQIRRIVEALDYGLEMSRESLTNHDAQFGRTTGKNRWWAMTIEGSISAIQREHKELAEICERYPDSKPAPKL